MISSKVWHKIVMQEWAPVWLRMYCLRQIFRDIRRHIESLPSEQRARFDGVDVKSGTFRG